MVEVCLEDRGIAGFQVKGAKRDSLTITARHPTSILLMNQYRNAIFVVSRL
jgi:hypothetical protein